MGGAKIFFACDMAVPATPLISPVDLLMIPVGGGKVFDALQAARYVREINHQGLVIPVHYHGKADPASPQHFKTLMNGFAEIHILNVGESVEVVS